MKEISSGLIITNGVYFLGCKITGQNIYDIPKGKIDENETPIEACIREVREETGLIVDEFDLIPLGLYKYTPKKDLYLHYLFMSKLPDIDNLTCLTTFTHPKLGIEILEINGYKHIKLNEINLYMGKSMNITLKNVFNVYDKYFNKVEYLKLLKKSK